MVNTAPLLAMWHKFVSVLGMGAGIILGYAAGRPVKRRIIRKWAKRP